MRTSAAPAFEAEYLSCSLEGDVVAYGELLRPYQEPIYRFCWRWTRDGPAAEELAQETFLKAWRELKTYRQEAKFSTWLFKIALNLCRDAWRKQQRRSSVELLPPDVIVTPEQALQGEQEQAYVRQQLQTLPDIYREAIYLRFFEALSFEDCAEIAGETVSAMKMRVLRGLKLLREAMRPKSNRPGL